MNKKSFGTTRDGKAVDQFTLTNASGASVSLINYGATVTHVLVPDKTGKLGDVALGFDDLAGYQSKDNPYFGATVGRVANRIAKGTYTVDGKVYHCAINNGANSLHGGLVAYDKRVWDAQTSPSAEGKAIMFSLTDPDGREGFPGTVKASVTFTLTDTNTLRIEYAATTDKTTPINLTNHSYWNLKDGGKSGIAGHILQANADKYLPVDDGLIPTGELAPVKGTPIDFTTPKPMGQDLLAMVGEPAGYDHCLVLRGQDGKLTQAIDVYEPTTGRTMEVWTTEPGLQLYDCHNMEFSARGHDDRRYGRGAGLALEAQRFPDSPNRAHFQSAVLRPGETYRQRTEYRFTAPRG